MNLEESRRLWNAWAERDPMWAVLAEPDKKGNRWEREEFFRTGEAEISEVMRYIQALGIEPEAGKALDFGSGMGRLTQALAGRFREPAGVDLSPQMVRLARTYNRQGERCRYFLNPEPNLRIFTDASFDMVYSSLTLQHLEPRYIRAYLQEFLRVLAPGGVLVFDLPAEEVVPRIRAFRRTLSRLVPQRLLRAYRRRRYAGKWEMHSMRPAAVTAVLSACGGKIVAMTPRPTHGWHGFRYYVTKPSVRAAS